MIGFRRDRREAVFLFTENVRYWHKADMDQCTAHVRYWGQSGHALLHCKCLLLTQSGHPGANNRGINLPGTPLTIIEPKVPMARAG